VSDSEITLGPHLLGRLPKPDDERDFELRHWIANVDPLQAALANLLAAKGANPAVKAWAQIATQRIEAITPAPPDPPPIPPDPPPAPPAPTVAIYWNDPNGTLNQGAFASCVGHGESQAINADPPPNDNYTEGMGESATTGLPTARAVYYEATVIDGSPDDPDAPGGGQQGATVRSGEKAIQNRGRIKTYAAAATIDEITAWIRTKGPIVAGSDWTQDMFNPDPTGIIKPTGTVAGGHCYVLDEHVPAGATASSGATFPAEMYGIHNSWGDGWGIHGRAYIAVPDFAGLIAQGGEAWAAVELPLT
jgi:hypothetical protein